MKRIEIIKTYEYSNNKFLSLYFFGSNNNCIDIEKEHERKEEILNSLFSKNNIYPLNDIIKKIRTVFSSWEEIKLEVSCGRIGSPYGSIVKYHNHEIQYYQSIQEIIINKKKEFYKLEYKKTLGLTFFALNENCKGLNEYNYITKAIRTLSQLHDVKPQELNKSELILCEIYRIFFQENPNFSKVEDKYKANAMMILLAMHKITLETELKDFQLTHSIIYSPTLINITNQLAPWGEIKKDITNAQLDEYTKKTIKTIGNKICEYITQQPNPMKSLVELANVCYSSNHSITSTENDLPSQIAKKFDYQEHVVKKQLKIVRDLKYTKTTNN